MSEARQSSVDARAVLLAGVACTAAVAAFGWSMFGRPGEVVAIHVAGGLSIAASALAAIVQVRVRGRRSQDLVALNERLRAEVEDRRHAQELATQAQEVAHMGTWRWDVTKKEAEWSAELFRIYGLDPARHVPTYEDYLTRVHPADRDRIKAATEAVFRDHKPYSHDERIRRTDGSWRELHTWAQAELAPDGHLLALVGACQDVTDQRRSETALREANEALADAQRIARLGSWELDPAARRVKGSPELFNLMGLPSEGGAVASDLFLSLVDPAMAAGAQAELLRCMVSAEPLSLDLHVLAPDRPPAWLHIEGRVVERTGGRRMVGTAQDITAKREADAALRESLERFRALADASPIGIVHTRADGIVDYVNDKWRQITGVADHNDREAMRRSVHREDQPAAAALWRACVKEGRGFDCDMRFVHGDGAVRWTRARAVPVRDAKGAITGFMSALADITDQRAAEAKDREVRRLREQAEFKTNFLRTAAHELGTPLTPIKIQMHILRDLLRKHDHDAVEEERKAADILDRNIGRLHVLVRDMLESARLQSGRLKLAVRPMDMAQVVHEVVETFQGPAIQTGVTLDTQGPSAMPMSGDPDRLSQVLYNLLTNSMKFTPPGGSIHVRLAPDGGAGVRVTVQDTGSGFTREQAAQLFQPFTQLEDPQHGARSGSGLGLYISRGIVEQHGGRLTCESAGPGRGATFTFTVPLVTLPLAPVAVPSMPMLGAPQPDGGDVKAA